MRKIKILYIIDKLHIGGAQKHILQLLKRIDKEKFTLYICCLHYGGELIEEAKSAGAKMLVLNIKRIYDLSGIRGIFKLVRFIKKERIDIVHTFLFASNIAGNIAARLAGAPLVISGRRDMGIHCEGKWRHRRAYQFAHRFADRVFAVSNTVRDRVHKYEGVSLDKIITIYNGADIEKLQRKVDRAKKKKELGIGEDDKVVGIISRLSQVKGHRHFLEAAKSVLKNAPNVKFLIIGDGPLKSTLQSLVHDDKLEHNILFLGNRSDVPELLSIMDVSVNASYAEGMSNVVLESMVAGVPIVATNVGGNKELLADQNTGFLVDSGNPQAMSERIISLLTNEKMAHRMGQSAQRMVEDNFSTAKMISRIENAYEELLNEGCNRSRL